MSWKNISKIIGKAAPLIGTAIGGPAGAGIGAMVASTLGVENEPLAIEQALKNDPEALNKLKELELSNEQHIRDHLFKMTDIELKDLQDARQKHKDTPVPAVICFALTAMVAVAGTMLFVLHIPDDNKELCYLLFGTMLAKWGDSIAYWVGTSRGSAEKNKQLIGAR